jgi:hypothetical protein
MNKYLLFLWIVVLAACSSEAEPVFPTPRPTVTITPTSTVTPTAVPPTDVPVQPLTVITATFGPSPTALIGATPLVAIKPTATLPPPAALGSLNIEYFTTDAVTVHPGDAVTLYWSITGIDQALIYRLNDDGSHDQVWQVRRSGSVTVITRTTDKLQTRFTISVGDSMGRIERTLAIPLTGGQCADNKLTATAAPGWFFAPSPTECPGMAPLLTAAAQQPFEHGQMIWMGSQTQIYVLFNDGKTPAWNVYNDTFKDGQPDRDSSLNPPANLTQPIRGFGLIWRAQPTVRDRLGWAIGAEQGFDGAYQIDSNTVAPMQYLRLHDLSVVQLAGSADPKTDPKLRLWKLLSVSGTPAPVPTATAKR